MKISSNVELNLYNGRLMISRLKIAQPVMKLIVTRPKHENMKL